MSTSNSSFACQSAHANQHESFLLSAGVHCEGGRDLPLESRQMKTFADAAEIAKAMTVVKSMAVVMMVMVVAD